MWASWFQRRRVFKFFFHYKSLGANEPQGLASLDPRGLIGRIYVVDHYTLLHTKYTSSRPHVSERKIFFSHYKSVGGNDHWGVANLDPKGMVGRIYVGDHLTSLHT